VTPRSPAPERAFSVRTPSQATSVVVGAGTLGRLEALLAEVAPRATRTLFVVDAGVALPGVHQRWAGEWRLEPERTIVVAAGEAAKTREVHAAVEDAILAHGLFRDDVVVAVGGGAVLDVAGYAAATVRRGVAWVAVPTSVVGQVDACVGGKTAVNHARGKNLLGAFHPPALALVDVTTLRTLPSRDRVAGVAEIYKTGRVGDPELLGRLANRAATDDDPWWVEVVAAALKVKARLVERDEHDVGERRLLNYGHTLGHALETALGPQAVRHGEGVAIGMGVAAEVARGRGWVDREFVETQDADLVRLGLPTRVPLEPPAPRLLAIVQEDKKRRAGGLLTLVLPRDRATLAVLEDVTPSELEAAIAVRRERRVHR